MRFPLQAMSVSQFPWSMYFIDYSPVVKQLAIRCKDLMNCIRNRFFQIPE